MTLFKKILEKQKEKNHTDAKPVNLEALVNSGRVRISQNKLTKIKDRSSEREGK